MSRNLRRKPRISYYEIEEPDFDEYVFCDECDDYVYEYCSIHGPLLVLPDDKVPTPTGFPSFVPRAALTIPQEFLHLNHSTIPGAGLGVFASLTLPKGVRLGPYVGQKIQQATSEYCWQIYDGSIHKRPLHMVDAGDPQRSNWMRYVNCSRHWSEQNLIAYQYRGELYYRTIKIIPRMSELMVFYGAEYARALRIDLRLYNNMSIRYHTTRDLPPIETANETTSKKDAASETLEVVEPSDANRHSPSTSNDLNNNQEKKKHEKKDTKRLKGEKKETDIKKSKHNKNDTLIKKRDITPIETNKGLQESTKCPENVIQTKTDIVLSTAMKHSCTLCKFKTNNEKYLNSHMKAHSGDRSFVCDTCSYITANNIMLIHHMRTHTGEKPYACEICDKRFSQVSCLKTHKRTHTGEKPYACEICDKRFSQVSDLKRHKRTHTGEKPYACEICDKRFSKESNLKRHKITHTGEKPYACEICDKRFSQEHNLKQHKRTHTGEKPYACEICDKRFSLEHNLKQHKRTHTGEKPYACEICNKRFTQGSALKTHKRTHIGEKPYACEICNKRFSQINHLKTHKRTHTGEKTYACEICNKRFSEGSYLKKHKRTHTGEKPYACEICDKTFVNRESLKSHFRAHIGEKP